MSLSARRTRTRAALDAAIAFLSSVVIGYVILRWHEPGIAGIVAMTAGLIFVTTAAVSLLRRRPAFSTPADRVTLVRAVLAGGCATVVVLTLFDSAPSRSWLLFGIAAPALLLDAVDGWVARRTGTANAHGARFDMETDSAFLMILSIPVALVVGPWALAIGGMRYLFWVASWWRPALRQELKFSQFRRVTAGIQGVVLVFALIPLVPSQLAALTTALALVLLIVSFGKDVISLERDFKEHRTSTETPNTSKVSLKPWLWTALAVVVAFFLLRAAWEKLVDVPSALAPFVEFGWPLWMADATAIAEIVGAIALIVPRFRPPAGLLLTPIMVGAAFTNIANGHPDYLWVNALLIAGSLLLAWQAQKSDAGNCGDLADNPQK